MSKNQKKLNIEIFIILLFIIFIFSLTWNKNPQTIENSKNTQENTQSITILAGETTAHLLSSPNTLFYNALIQERDAGKITFSGKNYPGLGFFVTDIGTLHSGNGKNLLYYINGKQASVGVSFYTLKDGDIIEWKLE